MQILPYAPPIMPTAKMYTLTLIVTKNNDDCSNLKNVDSLTKQFYLWPEEYTGSYGPPFHFLPIFGTYAGYKNSKPGQLVYVTLFDTVRTAENLPCNVDLAGYTIQFNKIKNLAYNNFSSENFGLAFGGAFYRKGASIVILNFEGYYPSAYGCYGSKYIISYRGIARLDFRNKKKINIDYQYRDTVSYN